MDSPSSSVMASPSSSVMDSPSSIDMDSPSSSYMDSLSSSDTDDDIQILQVIPVSGPGTAASPITVSDDDDDNDDDEDIAVAPSVSGPSSPALPVETLESLPLYIISDIVSVEAILNGGNSPQRLIYGEGYDGFNQFREGILDELLVLSERTPNLRDLEIRGVWDLTLDRVPDQPIWPNVERLILPSQGVRLDRFAELFLHSQMSNLPYSLVTLQCPSAFFEWEGFGGISHQTFLFQLINLTITNPSELALGRLISNTRGLESLELKKLPGTNAQPVSLTQLQHFALTRGYNVKRLKYSVDIMDDNNRILGPLEVRDGLQCFHCVRLGTVQTESQQTFEYNG